MMGSLRQNSKRGFTLIEIMIAISIMTFISLFTARMIQQGVQAKTKIQGEVDRNSGLKSALALMSQDIQLAFNYRDINAEVYNAAQKSRQPTTTPTPNPQGQNPADDKYKLKEEKTITRFYGEKDKLNFTSLNNFRPVKNLQESDQIEVGYYLESCSGRIDKKKSSQCLWRRTSPYVDEDVTEGGTKIPILENVKNLRFRYLGNGHEEEWVDRWHTEQGEEVMKGHFPNAVEITLSIEDPKAGSKKDIAMTIVAAVRFANNKQNDQSGQNGNPQTPNPKH